MALTDFELDHATFEELVRGIARVKWSQRMGQGSMLVDGRERDGYFDTGDFIFIVEATVSRKAEKIESDATKTADLVKNVLKSTDRLAKGYIITLHEPTPEQRLAAAKHKKYVNLLSFEEFRNSVFPGAEYLQLRNKVQFGSIFDYSKNSFHVSRDELIEPQIFSEEGKGFVSVADIFGMARSAQRLLLLAEYGTGKSMLLRELFYRLAEAFLSRKSIRTPIYINVKDHIAQTDCVEILERHAKLIGLTDPSVLVKGWRSGFVDILIDGFDELSTRLWTSDLKRLKENRRDGLKGMRDLIRQTPKKCAVVVCGRSNYFDSRDELFNSLGVTNEFRVLRLGEFGPEQVSEFLSKKKLRDDLPGWVALLHKSAEGRSSRSPRRTYPLASVMGVPSAVKPLSTATLTWNSAT